MASLFLWLVAAAFAGPWTDRVRETDCKDLLKIRNRLNLAIQQLHESCSGPVRDQSDRCRGVDLAEAWGEIHARSAECRRTIDDIPWM